MYKRVPLLMLLTLVLVLIPYGMQVSVGQDSEMEYFPATGHIVSGEFLKAYRSIPNPEIIYGDPITEAFESPKSGRLVQYFQRGHFEFYPDRQPIERVFRTHLGEALYIPGTPLLVTTDSPACRYFEETRHQVCYAFLDFYNANGGYTQFGAPISEIEFYRERMVQHFQWARFEWHPELPTGQRVTLTNLGQMYFYANNENPALLLPPKNGYIGARPILGLQTRAFVDQAVMSQAGEQTIFVIVQDQNLRPIPGAQVTFKVRYPSRVELSYIIPSPTDEYGITSLPFQVLDTEYGIAEVTVTVTYWNSTQKLEQETRSSFRIWY